MTYKILFCITYLMSLLPMRVHYFFSDLMYPLVYYIIRYRRKIVRKNLVNSFPEKDLTEIKKTERKFYRFFCDYFVENIKALTMKKEDMMKRMKFENMELIDNLFQNKQFIFLYLGHFCNWELIASLKWWFPKQYNTAQLYTKLHNKHIDRLFFKIRSRYGGENINKKEALRRIIAIQKTGQKTLIGFISDQGPKRESIHLWVDFLNQETPVFTGTERIAKKVDAGVTYGEVKRVKRGYYTCTFKLITNDPKSFGEHEMTRLYMKMLEADIRKDPARWLWTHNRWKRKHDN
ncbi:MAG: lysophospholipid acyltransferase family protein [Prevotellaceae bacterium]|nr:lysophospholipid acyltransferase family protein [Prevotellaceae bacterium]